MKRIKTYLGMLVIAVLSITSCQTDTVEEVTETEATFQAKENNNSENVTVVRHVYTYNGEDFSVNYTVDNESEEIVRVDGDVSRAEEIFSNDERANSILFTDIEEYDPEAVPQTRENVTIKVRLFDTEDEMEAYVEADGGAIPTQEEGNTESVQRAPCNSIEFGGQGSFYFYRDTYYTNELTSLRKTNKFYFRNHDINIPPYAGSDLTSFIVLKPYSKRSYTKLYSVTCFRARTLAFYQRPGSFGYGIPNLHRYTLVRWFRWMSWDNHTSSTIGIVW